MNLIETAIELVKNDSSAVEAIKESLLWCEKENRETFGHDHFGINMYLRNVIRRLQKNDIGPDDLDLKYRIPTFGIGTGGELGEIYLLEKLWKHFNNITLSSSDITELEKLYSQNIWDEDKGGLDKKLVKQKIDFWLNKKKNSNKTE